MRSRSLAAPPLVGDDVGSQHCVQDTWTQPAYLSLSCTMFVPANTTNCPPQLLPLEVVVALHCSFCHAAVFA